jgi:hypothetical protein
LAARRGLAILPAVPMDISAFLASLPEDRRHAISVVRQTILDHLPKGYEESIGGGMLVYEVPLRVYPKTYNKRPLMYAALGSQKNYMALYLCGAYACAEEKQRIEDGFSAAGKKLDMGKSCIRWKRLEDLVLPVIAQSIAAIPMEKLIELDRAVHSKDAQAARRQSRAAAAQDA